VERRGGVEGAGRGTGAGRSSVDRAFWRGRGRGRLTTFSLLSSRLDEHGDGEGEPDPGVTGDLVDLDEEAGHREKKGVELWRRRPRQQSPCCSREWTWPGPVLGRRPSPVRCHRVWTGGRVVISGRGVPSGFLPSLSAAEFSCLQFGRVFPYGVVLFILCWWRCFLL
jgi:hypothetical protein